MVSNVSDLLWLLVPTVLLLAAAAAELGARWWLRYRGEYYVFPPGLRLHLYPDRDVFPQLEPSIRFYINDEGERGPSVPRGGDGLYRVLVAGGSQPEGYLLDQDSSWPGALQRLLESPSNLQRLGAGRVHVGSIARSGVGSEALDLILERTLPRYRRLQLIIILVGVSDVVRWLEEGAPAAAPTAVRLSDVFRWHPEGPFGWTPPALALRDVLQRLRRRWFRPLQVHERAGRWIGDARAMRARAKVIRTTIPDPPPILDHFEIHFGRLIRRAKAHADRVLVVRQPWFEKDYSPEEAAHMWHGGAGQAWQQEVTTYYSNEVVFGLLRLIDARAAAVADAADVEQLDLMPVLERSLTTYYDCFHLTPFGARTIAMAVSARILRQPLHLARSSDRPEDWIRAS
jgi:lysophospholipase L1-like esterase